MERQAKFQKKFKFQWGQHPTIRKQTDTTLLRFTDEQRFFRLEQIDFVLANGDCFVVTREHFQKLTGREGDLLQIGVFPAKKLPGTEIRVLQQRKNKWFWAPAGSVFCYRNKNKEINWLGEPFHRFRFNDTNGPLQVEVPQFRGLLDLPTTNGVFHTVQSLKHFQEKHLQLEEDF